LSSSAEIDAALQSGRFVISEYLYTAAKVFLSTDNACSMLNPVRINAMVLASGGTSA